MTYYALEDLQSGHNLMHSGRNTQSLADLKEALLSYYGDDHDSADMNTLKSMSAEQLAAHGDFEIVTNSEPWPE